jgi:hypothetical protein
MKRNVLTNATLLLASAFALMALPSCTKDDVELTKTDLITKANWKMTLVEEKDAAGVWTDVTSTIEACELDNIHVFKTNLTYEFNEGATKCDAADPQVAETGTWKFENNETQVSFRETGSTTADVADIIKITADSLVFSKTYFENGNPYQYKVRFKH